MQLFVATQSSHISSRLDFRRAILLEERRPVALQDLSEGTAPFFMNAPDNNVLEFALAQRVILVVEDAEFILTDAIYRDLTGRTPEDAGVHIIAIGGTSFRLYLELARLPGNRVAALRDNDGDYQRNFAERFSDMTSSERRVYRDEDASRCTFEICVYRDNTDLCERLFAGTRRRLSIQEYMLANKAEAAFQLLEEEARMTVPAYISEAIAWINA